jgi:transposase
METIYERVGALDVHKAQVTACVRVPGPDGRRRADVVEFVTTVQGLMALHDWLAAHGVTHVAMEATGVYWQAVWHILEEDFELTLCNARHVKNVPGRKTDVCDAQWLCQLMEAGLLRASFVPPKPQRRLRTLTRYRKTQIAERKRETNRLHKALEDTGIKLDCVASDILGKSGRAMLDALVAGTTDPEVLADLAQGKLRAKIPALKQALEGRFEAHHALVIGAILAHLDFLEEQIDRLSEAIEEQLGPTGLAGVALASTITGVARRTAEVMVAEIGTDMSVFASARHLASWAGRCPGNDESAGKRRSGRTRKGSKWLGIALQEAALAAVRSKNTYLAAQYQRLKPRIGHGRALGAVKHSMLIAYWHMFSTGETYRDLGGDYFQRRDPARATKRLVSKLEALGHIVTLQPTQPERSQAFPIRPQLLLKGKYVCALCDCVLQGDGVAEALELGDEASGGAFGVAAGEVVAAGVAVGLAGAEHVPDGGQDGVLDGADRAAVPDPGAQAPVERLEVSVLRSGRGERGLLERFVEPFRAVAGASGALLAGRLVVAGALPGPRREVLVGCEDRHVGADLGEDVLCRAFSEAGDRDQ